MHYARHHKAARAWTRQRGAALPFGHRFCETCRLAVPANFGEAHKKTAHHAQQLAVNEDIEEAQAHFTADREGLGPRSSDGDGDAAPGTTGGDAPDNDVHDFYGGDPDAVDVDDDRTRHQVIEAPRDAGAAGASAAAEMSPHAWLVALPLSSEDDENMTERSKNDRLYHLWRETDREGEGDNINVRLVCTGVLKLPRRHRPVKIDSEDDAKEAMADYAKAARNAKCGKDWPILRIVQNVSESLLLEHAWHVSSFDLAAANSGNLNQCCECRRSIQPGTKMTMCEGVVFPGHGEKVRCRRGYGCEACEPTISARSKGRYYCWHCRNPGTPSHGDIWGDCIVPPSRYAKLTFPGTPILPSLDPDAAHPYDAHVEAAHRREAEKRHHLQRIGQSCADACAALYVWCTRHNVS